MLENIKKIIEECPNVNGKLYLIQILNKATGFFLMDKKVLLLSNNRIEKKSETIETEKLILNTKVQISTAINMPTFQDGEYNYVLYRGDSNDSDFENFIRICMTYVNANEKLSLKDFFFSIIDMFQIPKEQSFKNLLGIYGELEIILYAYRVCRWNLTAGWHKSSMDKYDFIINGVCMEIKSTMSDLLNVQLQHEQIFGKKGLYLGVVNIEESNAGMTLANLIDEINAIAIFRDDFNFQVALGKEINRVSKREMRNRKFNVKQVLFFENSEIPTLQEIPENITEITYRCALIGVNTVNIEEIYSKLVEK